MNVNEIIDDMTSKDVSRIRISGTTIIRNSQNESFIQELIPYKKQIEQSTENLNLSGVIESNDRFYKFPLEIIRFHEELKSTSNEQNKCTCELYLSESYFGFNPEVESESLTIELINKITGNWTQDYEVKCLRCSKRFHVSEREYHYTWWKWTLIQDDILIQESGNTLIDKEVKFIISCITTMIKNEPNNIELLNLYKERLYNFRMKLGSLKGTEYYEEEFGWTEHFQKLNNLIEKQIKNKA